MKPRLIVFLCCKNGKNTEYYYTSQKFHNLALLEEVDDKVPDDESLLCVWSIDWRKDDDEWEVVAEFGYKSPPAPENAEHFLELVKNKGKPVKKSKGSKKESKPHIVLKPLYDPPFKVVIANYPQEKAA